MWSAKDGHNRAAVLAYHKVAIQSRPRTVKREQQQADRVTRTRARTPTAVVTPTRGRGRLKASFLRRSDVGSIQTLGDGLVEGRRKPWAAARVNMPCAPTRQDPPLEDPGLREQRGAPFGEDKRQRRRTPREGSRENKVGKGPRA